MDGLIADKSKEFAIDIVGLCKWLMDEQKEYVLSKQLLRSGTSIGANVKEAKYAQSRADFVSKMSIALKEAGETEYWLELLYNSGYIPAFRYDKIRNDCVDMIKMLTRIVKNSKHSVAPA